MTDPKWAPGPWVAQRLMGNWLIHSADGANRNIALIPCGEAEAHLIEAAPELSEALERILAWASPISERAIADVEFGLAALQKAKGRTRANAHCRVSVPQEKEG